MERFESTIDIAVSSSTCYTRWHEFERFPTFMKHVSNVTLLNNNQWRWTVEGPLGRELSWDAQIDSDQRNHSISWHTVTDQPVVMQGTVRFDALSQDSTRLTCFIQFDINGGGLLEALASLSNTPKHMVDEDLENFKAWVEGTSLPPGNAYVGLKDEIPVDGLGTPIATSF